MFLEEWFGWINEDEIQPIALAEGECVIKTSEGILRGQLMDIQRQTPYYMSSTDSAFDEMLTVRNNQAVATVLIDAYSTNVTGWNQSILHSGLHLTNTSNSYTDSDYVYDGPVASPDL